ncbi:hypothetical protein F5146DRAFT_1050904 [Armillaria mellea]|nr:hypothetical protein F5146DRAFT_1050904 [Armillaria mellea]
MPYSNGVLHDLDMNYPRPKVTFLPPADSSITIMGVMKTHCTDYDRHHLGTDSTFFQVIRNHHEVIIVGPPVSCEQGCMLQLELIETLLDTLPFDEINRATLYITGDGRPRLIPQIFTIMPKIPFISGVRCIEDSWKLALLDGIPVEVDYAYDIRSSWSVQNRVEATRQLWPLDLTTPPEALLVSDDAIYGIALRIEDCLGNKVRFIRAFTGNWKDMVFSFDPDIHDQRALADARKSHWRVAEKLFEMFAPGVEFHEVWASPDFTIRPKQAYDILNIVFAPERPLDMLAFMTSITSLSDNNTSLSKKRLTGSSSQVAAANRSVTGESSTSSDEACHPTSSDESIDLSAVSDRPLQLSKRSSVTRRPVFLYDNLGIPTSSVLPRSTRLRGVSSVKSSSSIRSVVPLPPDDSDVAGIESSHGWLEEVP